MLTAKKRRTYPDLPSEQAIEKAKVEVMQFQPLAETLFPEAAQFWFNEHRRYIGARTQKDYAQYIHALLPFFGKLILREIHIGHIREYQDWRAQNAGAGRINMELSTLHQILAEANIWEPIGVLYKPLPVDLGGSGRTLSLEEEARFDAECLKKRRRLVAGHCLLLMKNTGCGFGELRGVRRRDVDLGEALLHIPKGKNRERVRTVPLNKTAYGSMLWLVGRLEAAGGNHADDLIIFHRGHGKPDFTKPMGSIKRAFAGIKKDSNIDPNFRIYDCRPCAITKALSSGKVSIHTAMRLFGHVSEQMQKRYYKPQLDVLRSAVSVLEESA